MFEFKHSSKKIGNFDFFGKIAKTLNLVEEIN
jgi:hypothetical protein